MTAKEYSSINHLIMILTNNSLSKFVIFKILSINYRI